MAAATICDICGGIIGPDSPSRPVETIIHPLFSDVGGSQDARKVTTIEEVCDKCAGAIESAVRKTMISLGWKGFSEEVKERYLSAVAEITGLRQAVEIQKPTKSAMFNPNYSGNK